MRLIFDLGGRTVYWDLPPEQGAVLLSSLVQTLGPADGEALVLRTGGSRR